MKIALLSDIHGNSVALDAVLANIESTGGVDSHWVLGDLVALGPDPVGVLDRLHRLPGARILRGNTDRYVATGDRPFPTREDVAADLTLLPRLIEVTATFAWTSGALAGSDHLEWFKTLALETAETLPDGSRLLGVHASPGNDDGPGFHPDRSDKELLPLLAGCRADIVCAGHTHRPFVRKIGRQQVINLGSVSLSPSTEKRASYVLITATAATVQIEHRLVAYDIARVIRQLETCEHPGRDFIIRHLRT